MLCLEVVKILPTIFAMSETNPPIFPAFNSTEYTNTPRLSSMCTKLSAMRDTFSWNEGILYKCLCHRTNEKTKEIAEEMYTKMDDPKEKSRDTLNALAPVFKDILSYLLKEFKKEENLIENKMYDQRFIFGMKSNIISGFVLNNFHLPIEQLIILYSNFLEKHIFDKYGSRFDKIGADGTKSMLKTEFALLKCNAREKYDSGILTSLYDTVRFMNSTVIRIINILSKNVRLSQTE